LSALFGVEIIFMKKILILILCSQIALSQSMDLAQQQRSRFLNAIDTLSKGDTLVGIKLISESLKGGLLKPAFVKRNINSIGLSQEKQKLIVQKAQLHRDRHCKKENKIIRALMRELLDMDQKYRRKMMDCAGNNFQEKTVRDSCDFLYLSFLPANDAFCLAVLDSITNEFGWINESWGGDSNTIFAIIHHNRSTLRENYSMDIMLNLAEQAYLNGEFSSFHALADGELLYHCQPQKYNTYSCQDENKQLVPCTPQLYNKARCP
jgi:hypothetical protein